ncbi:Tim44/TimA family putative adaptor protein [Kordiimonas marina]|uniref:Tim44/TimA family putative adaptor protein n=1 Tax=Kordiimonas marina TaxID=2872312 RepID=UPI001FF341B5|nr:Tim44/TimA family putative adaptor protein [Kordiimonas marina]MCJ9429821.1 Tim44/TimA family putative adaptor protein [Kordiimonas marina]
MFEIVLLAMVAAFILLRLRSELGKKTGNEPLPPFARQAPEGPNGHVIEGETVPREAQDNIIDLTADPKLRRALEDIRRADRSFDPAAFMDGAKSAYQMILEAFWAGDRKTLQEFLDDQVYSQFEGAITAREKNNYKLENRLLEIEKAELVGAQLVDGSAELTVHFKAEVIAITRDQDGNVVEGDVSDAVEMNDKWTFARSTRSRDPNWTLVATRAA